MKEDKSKTFNEVLEMKRQFIQEYHDYMDLLEVYPSKEVEKQIAKMWKANRAWVEEAEKSYKGGER